jgi:LmbE family N-acetylglucosaminyl deacetylase
MRVLVIAAHPDDEILGCGGAIARHVREGDEVRVMIMAEGLTSRSSFDRVQDGEELSTLARAAHAANAALGVAELTLLQWPDNRMDSIDRLDVIKAIESKVMEFVPERVYTHHAGDVNIDHRVIHDAVNTACRPLPGQPVRSVLYFEVVSSTEWQVPGSAPAFLPNWFVDITETFPAKAEALRCYASEMRGWPHPRSFEAVEHLARWRGATIGSHAAEGFMLGRAIL